jgi:radical SAM protein with 4Fe4S-binding SPASM domain
MIKVKNINEFRKTVCAVPWMHLALEPSGRVIPCCLTSPHSNATLGNLNKNSIEEIWNGDRMKNLRKQMIEGKEPAICNKCFDQERVTGESGRVHHANAFPELLKNIPKITEPDGTCNTMELKYWDFRFSNLCNFKCRSCGPDYSSAWVPDAKKLGWINEQDKVWNIDTVNDLTNLDFLKAQVLHVEKIYFAGGEPLMMPEHWQILELLDASERYDVKINYNTNTSTLIHNGKNVLDYWRKWKPAKIEVWPSLDEIGERAELIRSGTVWSKVEENLKAISELDNIIVRPGMTIGAWNVFRLPEIITYLVDIGVIKSKKEFGYHYNNFFINMLMQPNHYHVQILPDDFKQEVIVKLEKFIVDFDEKYDANIANRFTYILHELKTPFNQAAAKKFLEVTRSLDRVRNEDTFTVIPEMNCVKGALFGQ